MLTIQLPSLIRTGPPPTILTCLWTKHEVFVPSSVKRNEKTKWGVTQKFIRTPKNTQMHKCVFEIIFQLFQLKQKNISWKSAQLNNTWKTWLPFCGRLLCEGSPKKEGKGKKAYFCSKQWIGMRNEKKDVVTNDGCLEYNLSESVYEVFSIGLVLIQHVGPIRPAQHWSLTYTCECVCDRDRGSADSPSHLDFTLFN